MGGIYLTAYIVGYIAMYPRLFSFILEDLTPYGRPEKDEIIFAGWFALLLNTVWPLIVIGILLDRFVFDPLAKRVMKEYRR